MLRAVATFRLGVAMADQAAQRRQTAGEHEGTAPAMAGFKSAPGVAALARQAAALNASPRVVSLKALGAQLSARAASRPVPPLAPARPNRTGLPDRLKHEMESIAAVPLDDVRVHRNSAMPAQLRAHAYAQGADIHLGPGQERHLPHELGHVVQQKQGRVAATQRVAGHAINADARLEREADLLGARASQTGHAAPSAAQPAAPPRLASLPPTPPGVVQGVFIAPSGTEIVAARRYVVAMAPQFLPEFDAIASAADKEYLYKWLVTRLGLRGVDFDLWKHADAQQASAQNPAAAHAHAQQQGAAMQPPASSAHMPAAAASSSPSALDNQGMSDRQPAPASSSSSGQHSAAGNQPHGGGAPPGGLMSGTVFAHQGSPCVSDGSSYYWLHPGGEVHVGQEISFYIDPTRPDCAFRAAPQAGDPKDARASSALAEAGPTVPRTGLDLAAGNKWLKEGGYAKYAKERIVKLISGLVGSIDADARNLLDHWNAAHPAEPISLEAVSWARAGYDAATPAPAAAATSSRAAAAQTVILPDGTSVTTEVLNDSGGYHVILHHPALQDFVIRKRRDAQTGTTAAGMVNYEKLRANLNRLASRVLRVPVIGGRTSELYVVERVAGTVDALELWRQFNASGGNDPALRARLQAIQEVVGKNIDAMREGKPEPYPDFRPDNVGASAGSNELIYIDFDQQGDIKDEATLTSQIEEWAGRRYPRDPGGARAVDPAFFAFLTGARLRASTGEAAHLE
jgi:hypothetical protein